MKIGSDTFFSAFCAFFNAVLNCSAYQFTFLNAGLNSVFFWVQQECFKGNNVMNFVKVSCSCFACKLFGVVTMLKNYCPCKRMCLEQLSLFLTYPLAYQ